MLIALTLGLMGCGSGEADKNFNKHKEKPVHPAPANPDKAEQK